MKKLFVIVSGLLFSPGIFAQPAISDPNIEVREVKNFHAISVSSAFDVFLTQDNEEKCAVSAAEPKDLANIKVEVKNGVLEISWEHKGIWSRGNKKLKAYISFKTLDKLSSSGACDVSIVGVLKTNELTVDLSGASDLKGKIDVGSLAFELSGASDATLTGTATKLDIEASGASSFKGFNLSTDYCNARAYGASDIKITVNKELSASAGGASDIDYKGAGVVRDIKANGSSRINRS